MPDTSNNEVDPEYEVLETGTDSQKVFFLYNLLNSYHLRDVPALRTVLFSSLNEKTFELVRTSFGNLAKSDYAKQMSSGMAMDFENMSNAAQTWLDEKGKQTANRSEVGVGTSDSEGNPGKSDNQFANADDGADSAAPNKPENEA